MKYKYLLLFLTAFTLLTASCDDDENESTGSSIPNGALPSAEFSLNNLGDEPYAESAKKFIVQYGDNEPFQSIEFLPDGHYLMLADETLMAKSGNVSVALAGNKINITKRGNRLTLKPTMTRSGDETVSFGKGNEYGTYTKSGDNKYVLSSGAVLEIIEETGSNSTISYLDRNGIISTVYVNTAEKTVDDATRSLCRTWNINSIEVWGYVNSAYMVYGKQTISNGKAKTEIKFSPNFDEELEMDDFIDVDSEAAYQVVFTSYGTYIVSYLDGETELALWNWTDKSQGILHYEDNKGYDYDYDWLGECTVRFAGKQMRIYEDYTDIEGGLTCRIIGVNTLTAKH